MDSTLKNYKFKIKVQDWSGSDYTAYATNNPMEAVNVWKRLASLVSVTNQVLYRLVEVWTDSECVLYTEDNCSSFIARFLKTYTPLETLRIINLHDCDTNYLVKTNVQSEVIDEAISYKNDLLCKDIPISSDFESMQEYIWGKNSNYVFEPIGYINDLESYEW